jgi:hypothetical protein
MGKSAADKMKVKCYFCGLWIAETTCDPCGLELTMGCGNPASRATNITFFAHLRCVLASAEPSQQDSLADVIELD